MNNRKPKSDHSRFQADFIPEYGNLKKAVAGFRAMGKKIVLTQGTFDMIHIGHSLYMEKARSFGDVLIVGVDSDKLTKKWKGPKRPVVKEDERIAMIRFLRQVDVVTMRYHYHSMGHLVRVVRPDVLVISTSTNNMKKFTQEMKKEHSKYCGKIEILPPQATTSTTAGIRLHVIEGAEKLGGKIVALVSDFIKNENQ